MPGERDWIKSKVWCLDRQKLLLLSDNHSSAYLYMERADTLHSIKNVNVRSLLLEDSFPSVQNSVGSHSKMHIKHI